MRTSAQPVPNNGFGYFKGDDDIIHGTLSLRAASAAVNRERRPAREARFSINHVLDARRDSREAYTSSARVDVERRRQHFLGARREKLIDATSSTRVDVERRR